MTSVQAIAAIRFSRSWCGISRPFELARFWSMRIANPASIMPSGMRISNIASNIFVTLR